MNDKEQTPAVTNQPANTQSIKNKFGRLLLVGIVIVVGGFFMLGAIGTFLPNATPNVSNSVSSGPQKMTKAAWRQKLQKNYGQMAAMGQAMGWNPQQFQQLMGKPDSTQTIGDSVYWYYDCSDGQMQLSLDAGPLNVAGIMNGQINDF